VGASSSRVEVAQASLTQAEINLKNVQVQSARIFELDQKGLVAKAKVDDMRADLAAAKSKVAGAQADLEKARQQLGDKGADNPQIRSAIAQLGEAELNLEWTELHAPSRGAVVNLTIGEGTFAKAGQGLMNLVSFEEVWVEAYLTENSLARMSVGDPVEIVLDLYPGRIFKGEVSSITNAASAGPDAPARCPGAATQPGPSCAPRPAHARRLRHRVAPVDADPDHLPEPKRPAGARSGRRAPAQCGPGPALHHRPSTIDRCPGGL
jgi:multidrug resistance efflux pump